MTNDAVARRARRLVVLLAGFALVLIACGETDDGIAPVRFTGASGPALYAQACASCHGTDLRGTDQGPPFIDALYRPGHHADAAFLLAVRRGVRSHHWDFGNMPRIEGLSDDQVKAIVQYVRERQRAEGIE